MFTKDQYRQMRRGARRLMPMPTLRTQLKRGVIVRVAFNAYRWAAS